MFCHKNCSDKTHKFLKLCINHHWVPPKIHVDQGTNFLSKDVKGFCNTEDIEIEQSPVNDYRATGCVERTIGSLKISRVTYAREERPAPLEKMVKRAFGALWFSPNATIKLTPTEAHRGRETNTVLQNLPKKPSLRSFNWSNVLKFKSACLDEQDPEEQ